MPCLREGVPFLLGDWGGERVRAASELGQHSGRLHDLGLGPGSAESECPAGNYCALGWGPGNAARWSVGTAT